MKENNMKLSIIMPCYNEVKTIETIVQRLNNLSYPKKEIIIVDDGSTDGTKEKLERNIASIVDKVIYHKRNYGKGAAIRSGLAAVTGDIVVIQDADLEYDPNEIIGLIGPIVEGVADVVYGSRFTGYQPRRGLFFWHMLGNKFLTVFSNMLTNLSMTDIETGYKSFRSEIIKKITIEENRFGFEMEITAKVAKMKCRIYEIGISYHGRTYSEGKKINWKDGLSALRCAVKYNFFK